MRWRTAAWLGIWMLVILVIGGVAMLWLPTEDIRIGALAAGATQAVRDLNETYKAALSGRPTTAT